MVALLTPNTFESERFAPAVAPVGLRGQSEGRPALRVLQGGLDGSQIETRRIDSSLVVGLVVMLLVLAGVFSVRAAQGTPPAEFETSPAVSGGFVPVVEAVDLLATSGLGS